MNKDKLSPTIWEIIQKYECREVMNLPDVQALIKWGENEVAYEGSLTVIVGRSGHGKTTILFMLVVTLLLCSPLLFATGFTLCIEGIGAVIYIDTEMPIRQTKKALLRLRQMLGGGDILPSKFYHFSLNGKSAEELNIYLDEIIKEIKIKDGKITAIFIDHGTDFMTRGANDEDDSKRVIQKLKQISEVHLCALFVAVHANRGIDLKGDKNPRGHYGHEIERKADFSLEISRNEGDNLTVRWGQKRRDGGGDNEITYSWDESKRMHVFSGSGKIKSKGGRPKKGDIEEVYAALLREGLTQGTQVKYRDKIIELFSVSEKTAMRRINELTVKEFLSSERDGTLRIKTPAECGTEQTIPNSTNGEDEYPF